MLHGAGIFTYKTGSFMGQMLGFIFQHHGAYGHNRLVNVDFDTHQQKVISTDQNPNQTQGTHIPNLWWLITASWLYPSTPPQPHPNTVVSLYIYVYIQIPACYHLFISINPLLHFPCFIVESPYITEFCLPKSMVNVVNPKQYTICSKSPAMGRTNHPQMVGLSLHFPHYIIISTKNCVNATLMHPNTSY